MTSRFALPWWVPLLVLAACTGPSAPPQGDHTPPRLVASVPADGATAVPTDLPLGLTFDEAMDPSSLTLRGTPPITFGAATWNAERTSAGMPHDELAASTAYRVSVEARDLAGNALPTMTFDFATAATADTTPPTIQASEPEDGATGVSPRAPRVRLTFSEAMNPASLRFTFLPRFGADDAPPDEPFDAVWSDGDRVVTIEPSVSQVVPENTTFELHVNATDLAGNGLTGRSTVTFTTGADAPALVSSTPADGATEVPPNPDAVITLTFSKPLDPGTVAYDTNVDCDPGTLQDSDTTLVLTECRLWDGHDYVVGVSARGTAGGAVDVEMRFSTVADAGSPHVSETTPGAGATLVARDAPITIAFDDEMDAASTVASVTSSLPLGCTWQLVEGFQLTCPAPSLAADATYVVTVGTGARDTSGNAHSMALCRGSFPCPYAFTFATGATVDVTRPTVLTDLSEPDDGASDVPLTSTLNVIFSERMNEASVEQAFAASIAGAPVAGTFGWFNSGMVFFPAAPLPACTEVRVQVGTSAMDRATNPLASAYDIRFTTVCP